MATRRKHKRRRIKEDHLVTYAVRASQFTRQHFAVVVGGLVVLIVAAAFILFTAQSRRNAALESERMLALGLNYYMIGDHGMAAKSLQDLIAQHSGRRAGVVARYFLGECQLALGLYAEALNAYDDYLSESAKQPEFEAAAVIGKAYAYEGLRDYRQAAEALSRLAPKMDSGDPRYLDVLFRAGDLYRRAGDRDIALQHFQRVADQATGRLKQEADVAVALLAEGQDLQ